MKIKTLVKALLSPVDEVEMYAKDYELVSKMSQDTLLSEYGDYRVDKFWVYTDREGLTILEVSTKGL